MKAVRVGVIGVGHLGYHHARLYAQLPDVELAALFDLDTERARDVAQELDTQAHAELQAFLNDGLDAVSVAAPTAAHHDLVTQCLAAGLDVLVEKPIAGTVEEAQAMNAAAKAGERVLQVGHVERFNGAVMALTKRIGKPRFIECHRLSPFPGRGHDVSVVLDLMIHDLDVVLALTRANITSIDAVGVPRLLQRRRHR